MASNDSDPSFIVHILEDFRNTVGRSNALLPKRQSLGLHTGHQDGAKDCFDEYERRFSGDDYSNKFRKLDGTPKTTREASEENNMVPSPSASPWESHHLRSQLLDANVKITDLENQVGRLHALRQEMELVFQKDRESVQKQLDSERSKSRDLENHLQVIRKREVEIKDQIRVYKAQANKDKLSFEERIQELERENSKLKDSLHEKEQSFRNEKLNLVRHIHHLKADVSEKEVQLTDTKARNSELEQRLQDKLHVETQLEEVTQELRSAELKMKELQKVQEDHLEAAALVKAQQKKVFHYCELEKELASLQKENKNLKNAISNKLLLEEMVEDLTSRQALCGDQEQALAWAQGRVAHLQTLLEQWHAVARDHCEGRMSSAHPPDPSIIHNKMMELQQCVHVLTAELGEVKSQLSECLRQKETLTVDLQAAKKEVEKFRNMVEQHTDKLRLLQKRNQLVTAERDSYRSQLDTYEKELTISCSSLSSHHSQQQLQQMHRLETMEKVLDGYRKMLKKMDMESGKCGYTSNVELLDKLNSLECERNKLLQEKGLLQRRKDELEVQLEYRAIKGDFNPITSKVLHFRLNPAAEAAAQYEDEMSQLRAKCARLEERIKLIEEGNVQDITQKVEENIASSNAQEVKDLQDAISAQELKMQRLKEVFHASAKEFREVCYELFGYKIDRNENIYKLSSMYAESPDDHLMFKRASDGTIDMMQTSYSATLGDLIDINLHHHRSLPLFLGAITLDLFNRQTLAQSVD